MAILYAVKFAVDAEMTGIPTEKRCVWNSSSGRKVGFSTFKYFYNCNI